MRIAAALLSLILLSGAGSTKDQTTARDISRIRTIAVIPALGSTFQFEHVTAKPLEFLGPPDARFLEISDWGLDEKISREVSAALETRFTIKPIVFQSADFSSWNGSLLKHASLDLNGDPAIDAYVFILRDWRRDEIGHSVHALGGLGLYRRDGARARYGVYACYRIIVVDALTGDIIASRAALFPHDQLPWIKAGPDLWPATPDALDAVQRDRLQEIETRLIEMTLRPTLAALGLTR